MNARVVGIDIAFNRWMLPARATQAIYAALELGKRR
jgi:hypothetical protein